jgi:hypothetical protein
VGSVWNAEMVVKTPFRGAITTISVHETSWGMVS